MLTRRGCFYKRFFFHEHDYRKNSETLCHQQNSWLLLHLFGIEFHQVWLIYFLLSLVYWGHIVSLSCFVQGHHCFALLSVSNGPPGWASRMPLGIPHLRKVMDNLAVQLVTRDEWKELHRGAIPSCYQCVALCLIMLETGTGLQTDPVINKHLCDLKLLNTQTLVHQQRVAA